MVFFGETVLFFSNLCGPPCLPPSAAADAASHLALHQPAAGARVCFGLWPFLFMCALWCLFTSSYTNDRHRANDGCGHPAGAWLLRGGISPLLARGRRRGRRVSRGAQGRRDAIGTID